jgi:tetratricopeptide (TPR) repeat protein
VKTVTDNDDEVINDLFDREDWHGAIGVISAGLDREPKKGWMRHWWLTRLSTAYYELRDYTKALELARAAYRIAPNCPLVLWDLAGVYEASGDSRKAVATYSRLLKMGVRKIATDECGEGIDWAKAIIGDVHYRLGLLNRDMGKLGNAIVELSDYIRLRTDESLYSASRAKAVIRELVKRVDRSPIRSVGPAA